VFTGKTDFLQEPAANWQEV